MKHLVPLTWLPAALLLASCGGSSSSTPPPAPAITVSPTSATLIVKGTQQFTANVSNASSTLVNWQVNSVAGGNSSTGTIDSNGLYTAPSTVPTSNVVTITAVSQAVSTLTATASVTINPAPTFTVSPAGTNAAPVVVRAGDTQPFSIVVSGGSSVPVTWEVNGQIGGTSTIGTITQQGNYIAPQIPPPGALVTITAVSQADSTQTSSAVVQVTFSNLSLSGPYVFSTRGAITTTGGFINRIGSFTATSQTSTGSGTLTAGLEDVNETSVQPNPASPAPFTGTYSITADGRGTMQFCENTSSGSCPPSAVTATFRIVVISAVRVQIIEFDSFATGVGEMDPQDVSAFNAGLSGSYSFDLSGISSVAAGTQHPGSWVGEFSANGAGGITSGETDLNDGGTLTSPQIANTSSYATTADGRGTLTFNTSTTTFNIIFYIISAGRVKFLERDALPALVGDAFKQQQTPGVPWANSSLFCSTPPCTFVFGVGGTSSATGAGLFTSDGNGNLVAGSGLIDRNLNGTATSGTLAGTYSIDASGRGTAPLAATLNGVATPVTFAFYMISTGMAVIQETDSANVADGLLLLQHGGPFTAASLQGSYALNLAGLAGGTPENFVGQITADGAGKVTSGSLDININDFAAAGQPLMKQLPGEAVSGTYASVSSAGRATLSLNPSADNRNFVLYFVSPAQVFVLGADSTRVAAGVISKQF